MDQGFKAEYRLVRRTALDVLLLLDTPAEAFQFAERYLDFEGLVRVVLPIIILVISF